MIDGYLKIGVVLGWIVSAVTFLALWGDLIGSWGAWGFLLGWIPAGMGAYVSFWMTMLFWGVAVMALGGVFVLAH